MRSTDRASAPGKEIIIRGQKKHIVGTGPADAFIGGGNETLVHSVFAIFDAGIGAHQFLRNLLRVVG